MAESGLSSFMKRYFYRFFNVLLAFCWFVHLLVINAPFVTFFTLIFFVPLPFDLFYLRHIQVYLRYFRLHNRKKLNQFKP